MRARIEKLSFWEPSNQAFLMVSGWACQKTFASAFFALRLKSRFFYVGAGEFYPVFLLDEQWIFSALAFGLINDYRCLYQSN